MDLRDVELELKARRPVAEIAEFLEAKIAEIHRHLGPLCATE
jgi:hypothetical protein